MRGKFSPEAVSRRAPTMVIATLCAALVVYWAGAPLWLPYGMAILVGIVALVVMASRDRRRQFAPEEDAGSAEKEGWLAQELAGKGTASGSYLLGFFSLVTIVLTGFQGAYALPGWAALALSAAWGVANAHYSADEESQH